MRRYLAIFFIICHTFITAFFVWFCAGHVCKLRQFNFSPPEKPFLDKCVISSVPIASASFWQAEKSRRSGMSGLCAQLRRYRQVDRKVKGGGIHVCIGGWGKGEQRQVGQTCASPS